MKVMDDNSFNDQNILNLQKIRRAKDMLEDNNANKYRLIKDNKLKNPNKEDKTNREKFSEILNLYPENNMFNKRHASPILNNNTNNISNNSQNKKSSNEKFKDILTAEALNEKLRKLNIKKKK